MSEKRDSGILETLVVVGLLVLFAVAVVGLLYLVISG